VRNDTGVFEGGEISMFYDPMIAKLCTWGRTARRRIEAMRVALDSFEVEGIGHNLPFLSAVMDHPRFISGEITRPSSPRNTPRGSTAWPCRTTMRGVLRRRRRRCTGWRRSGAPASRAGWTTTSAALAPNGS
jgi:propionyl-CoA carboxylase alpha chain